MLYVRAATWAALLLSLVPLVATGCEGREQPDSQPRRSGATQAARRSDPTSAVSSPASLPTAPASPGAGTREAPATGSYARGPSAGPANSDSSHRSDELVIVAGGDVSFGRGLGQRILRGEPVSPLAGVEPILATADLVFVNLESQLSEQGGQTQSRDNPLIFTGPPAAADLLAKAGIDVVSVANNHIWDFGRRGFLETLAHLTRVGVTWVGASAEPEQMYQPVVLRKKGLSVALFAATAIWNQGSLRGHPAEHHVASDSCPRFVPGLQAARADHDVILFSYHGGGEYLEVPISATRAFARCVMEAGADALFGHHPHVPQGVGWHGTRPIFYSLGNLVFGVHSSYPWTGMGVLARLTFRRGRPPRVEACPYQIVGAYPRLLDGPTRALFEDRIRRHLLLRSREVGRTRISESGEQGCMVLWPG